MTPFSIRLRSLRESRGLLQKSLASELGVGATYLSALEQGRKLPPQNLDFFARLQKSMGLSADEFQELRNLATAPEKLASLAIGTSPLQLEIALDFAARLHSLQPAHIRAIKAILDLVEPHPKVLFKSQENNENEEILMKSP
ncbi:helix-turn-helix domain-containing protein [Collimonas arenae]|uniref:helix-turn-helix domain-containing protein n=1 Tax=Collimonas arenae TaxID=279058 RepID=UPI0007784FE0|nr:helix-turn-helix transcriptional regulator [Collimonas arenae]